MLFLIGAMIVFRIGPTSPYRASIRRGVAFLQPGCRGFLGIANLFSGGALSRLSIVAMGVMPYISASIIIQMLAVVMPSLDRAAQGRGRRASARSPNTPDLGSLVLAVVQSFAAAGALEKGGMALISGPQFLLRHGQP